MGASSEHFSDAELACSCCGENKCTPELVNMLEAFRAQVGKPVMVTSGYRCPEHNTAVGGAKASYHLKGQAADVKVKGMTAAQLEQAALQTPLVRGIGRDDKRGFVHLDVRQDKAHWCYDAGGKQCAYYPATT